MEGRNPPQLKQPKALYLLFFVQMWECFSYYGMRSILVLFMVNQLQYSDQKAFSVYAVYTALVEAGGIIGGYLADKIFGSKYTIFLGTIIIMLGHISMAIPEMNQAFYFGLALIVVGTSLFRTSCTTLLGEYYTDNDPRRDSGYTLFYVGINIGGFLATILCAYVSVQYGWHYGFSLAAFGMLAGIAALYIFSKALENKGIKKDRNKTQVRIITTICFLAAPFIAVVIFYNDYSMNIIPLFILACIAYIIRQLKGLSTVELKNVFILFAAIATLVIFFAFEEQVGTTLILFSERNVDRFIMGYEVPASSLGTMNPLAIIIVGPFISRFLAYFANKKKEFKPFNKIAFGFLLIAAAFAILYMVTLIEDSKDLVSMCFVLVSFALIAIAELFVAPTIYSLCSILAPNKLRAVLMGMVMLGFSVANLLSGHLSKFMAVDSNNDSMIVYNRGFCYISVLCIIMCIVIKLGTILCTRKSK
jgi:proton-dependent oligopeptide transporter, POT family